MSAQTDLLAAMRSIHSASYKFPARNPASEVYATYQKVNGRQHPTLNSGPGAQRFTFQIDVWSANGSEAVETVAEALKAGLPTSLKVGEIIDNPDDYETDTGLFRASFDVVVWT